MDEKITSLIIFAFVINIVLLVVIFYSYKRKQEVYYKKIKKHFLSLLALNISHLHDAANFFAILKNNINDSETQKLYNFSKGAQFHFRSLFEDLKLGMEELELSSSKDLEKQLSIYQFAAIDLKDLLEMELIQVSNFDRLTINDCSQCEHALINGNFTLLSKAILNIVENALKHSDGQIKLELFDLGSKWEIKLSSLGKGIPENIAQELNNHEGRAQGLGHGLSGLSEIIDFHNAELRVDTLANEGTCIRLFFDKYNSKPNSYKPKAPKAPKAKSKYLIWTSLLVSLVAVIVSSTLITKHNKQICQNYYNDKTKNLSKILTDPQLSQKKYICQESLSALKSLIEGLKINSNDELADSKNKILTIKSNLLENFHGRNHYLASYLIYEFLNKYSYSRFEKLLEAEALSLLPLFPGSQELNYIAANYHMRSENYLRGIYHQSLVIKNFAEDKLYTNPELYFISNTISQGNDIEHLSNILAVLYDGEPEIGASDNGDFMDDSELLNGDLLTKTGPPIDQISNGDTEINKNETLIDEQNKKLGLDLSL